MFLKKETGFRRTDNGTRTLDGGPFLSYLVMIQ